MPEVRKAEETSEPLLRILVLADVLEKSNKEMKDGSGTPPLIPCTNDK